MPFVLLDPYVIGFINFAQWGESKMEVSTTIELAPCPFCGRHYARMYKDHLTDFCFYVKCWCCGAQTQSEYSEEGAAKNWNRRKLSEW